MDFRILGPLEIADGERVLALGGSKRRAVAAALILDANRVVAAERLIDLVWGEEPPASAAGSLQNHVLRLRAELGDRIATRAPGYVLRVEPGELDLDKFRGLVDAARTVESAQAVSLLEEALALWRGEPLADLTAEPVAASAAPLGELRLEAVELRIDAQLELGRHALLLPELEALVAEHPFRERFRAQLLLALYRSGRQADALEAYAAARAALVEELGTEPGAELQELQRAILNQDPAIAAPQGTAPAARPAAAAEEARKPVTIVLAELAPASSDPEARREELRRLQREAADALVAHGGEPGRTGDTRALGIFGVPTTHEDDALRAVRAACELKAAGLVRRAGVATGDVITGDPGAGRPRVSGPPIEEADRLLAAAGAGDVLVGERTWRLVCHAVTAERRGGSHAIAGVHDEAEPLVRHLGTPLVGREDELEEVMSGFRRATRDGRARLVTVFGSPGVGKTRLAREVAERLAGEATCLVGRTPAYGDAPTYAPLRDAFVALAGGSIREWAASVLADDPDGELATARLAAAVGESAAVGPVEETAWATRRLLEALARQRPVVFVVEDIHWATSAFLDLVEHVATFARGPVLVLALARPELLDTRPDWAGGRLSASTVLLDPLPPVDAGELLDTLSADAPLDEDRRARILAAASGNPLFLEQLLAAARERDDAVIPDSLHALLAARLDLLGSEQRQVAQAAAVCGQSFPAVIVERLVDADVRTALAALARRDFVEPDEPEMAGEERWAFRHALLRDEAYASIPKRRRAELHERAARVIAELASGRALDVDELVGYHLEAAYEALREVEPDAPGLRALAAEASEHLIAAGLRARGEIDVRSAARLLSRGEALLPPGAPERVAIAPALVDVLMWVDEDQAAERVLEQAEAAIDPADAHARARLVVARSHIALWTKDELDANDLIDEMNRVIPILEAAGDHEALASAHILRWSAFERARGGQHESHDLAHAVDHARAAGARALESSAVSWLCVVLRRGPWHIDEAWRIARSVLDDPPSRFARGSALGTEACLYAMEGDFDRARALAAESHAIFEDGGLPHTADADLMQLADVEILAGEPAAAEAILRTAIERLDALEDRFGVVNTAWRLALVLALQGKDEEALHFAARSAESDAGDFVLAWRLVIEATVQARRGRAAEALRLLDEEAAIMEPLVETGFGADINLQAAEAAVLAGDAERAAGHLQKAFEVAGRLGYPLAQRRAQERLAELGYAAEAL